MLGIHTYLLQKINAITKRSLKLHSKISQTRDDPLTMNSVSDITYNLPQKLSSASRKLPRLSFWNLSVGNKKTDEKVKRGISTPQGLKMSSGALLALTFILPPERKNKTGSLLIGNGQETFFF